MNAHECLSRILNTKIATLDLKYCFVNETKRPIKLNGELARPNKTEDFVSLGQLLLCVNTANYAGLGISIQASNVCAVDVDHCFSSPNDLSSITKSAQDILNLFKDIAYCEFSFSGTGLRIIFKHPVIENYSDNYYIKNEKNGVEYYQPSDSFRYVTITGNTIYDNICDDLARIEKNLSLFLEKYMRKPLYEKKELKVKNEENTSIDTLLKKVRYLYLTNSFFQNLWFGRAPGSGMDESEKDFRILSFLYENATQNRDALKTLFENSNYFKSKDYKHVSKWEHNNYRYYNYIYEKLKKGYYE